MRTRHWLSCAAFGLLLVMGNSAFAAEKQPQATFGALETLSPEIARTKAAAWLQSVGKTDAATLQQFSAIWKEEQSSVLDRLADTFALGDAVAAKMLADARNEAAPAPTKVPDALKDAKLPEFYRANLALAYARTLSNRRVHEEALQALKLFRAEQVVDPASFLFHRAVCEHALLQKPEATKSIRRLLEEASTTAPERYKTVSLLMQLDMAAWKDKDLADIARKMKDVERRLDLARGGPQTQDKQKEIIARLDEMIKKLESQCKGGQCNGGNCPNGGNPGSGPPNGNNPSSPATESGIATAGGPGIVDPVKMKKLVQEWGRLPPREQARAMQELTRDMSPRYREAIENYFRNIAMAQKR